MSAEAAPRTATKKRARWAIVAVVVAVVVVVACRPMVMGGGEKACTVPTTTVVTGSSSSRHLRTARPRPTHVRRLPRGHRHRRRVDVSIGDTVEAGEALFTIDDADLQAAVRQANAQLSSEAGRKATQQVQQPTSRSLATPVLQAENSLDKLESLPHDASQPSEIDEASEVTVAKAGVTTRSSAQGRNASLTSAQVARSNAETNYAEAKATWTRPR